MLFQRVREIIRRFSLSQANFSAQLGLQLTTFNGYLNEKRENNLWPYLGKILEIYPEISREWLYFGEGEMLRGKPAEVPSSQAVEPKRKAGNSAPDGGDLAQRLLDAYAQNARLAEELVRANEERRRLQELLALDQDAGAAHMPTPAPGEQHVGRD